MFVAIPASRAAAGPENASDKSAPAEKTGGAKKGRTVAVLQTSLGSMTVEFYDKGAPKTVANFKALAKKGFYDGCKFHRIMKDFMVQTGDPNTKAGDPATWGSGGSGTPVPDEFSTTLSHQKGVLSMANTGQPNSQSSQFFICLGDAKFLDGKYSIFGHVVKGMDVLMKLGNAPVKKSASGESSAPVNPPVLKKVTIKTG